MKKPNLLTPALLTMAAMAVAQNAAQAQQWGNAEELKEFLTPAAGAKLAPLVTNFRKAEQMGLNKSRLAETPWTSDFWPDAKGSIADPYMETGAGPLQRNRALWRAKSAATHIANVFVRENRPTLVKRAELRKNIATASQETIDNLSPAEKYDMLLGDKDFTFTNKIIEMVDVRDDNDLVNPGAGLCHGWSPASLNVPRPQHSVTLATPFGRNVTFYPTDIKALTVFLWGKTNARTSFQANGWKCQTGYNQDEHGRSADPRCFNVNPAFFHLVAINHMGINKHGFAMDKSFTEGVWNHPVYGYDISYFNVTAPFPFTGLSFKEARTAYNHIRDPFMKYRAPGTKALVGVQMTVYFGNENRHPNHDATDAPSKDKTKSITLRYDLELSESDEIIGGEWREYANPFKPTVEETRAYTHPSIVWLAPHGTKAWSVGDMAIENVKWDGRGTAPAAWLNASKTIASLYKEIEMIKGDAISIPTPQPLGPVVDLLVNLSRK
jgi:hypothetical protein